MGANKTKFMLFAFSITLTLGASGFLLFGRSSDEHDLASADPGRVVGALASIDNASLKSKDNERLRSDALTTLKNTPLEEIFDRLRAADLSDEERQRLEANLRDLMMEDMERKVNAYFDAPEEEQDALLDAHVDEFQKFMGEMRAYHDKHKDDPEYQAERERRRQRSDPPTIQQRKERMEGRNPDQMVRMFRYMAKMRERAQERGIEFGPGRRGR